MSIPGRVLSRSSQLFQASKYGQFLHIAFVHDVDKDRETLPNHEPQTWWLPIKHSNNFSHCYKNHYAIRRQNKERKSNFLHTSNCTTVVDIICCIIVLALLVVVIFFSLDIWPSILTFDLWPLNFELWRSTFDPWPLTFDLSPLNFDVRPLTLDLWPLTFDLWPSTFDLWLLTWNLAGRLLQWNFYVVEKNAWWVKSFTFVLTKQARRSANTDCNV